MVRLTRLPRPGRPVDGGLASLGVTMMAAAVVGAAATWIVALLVIVDDLLPPGHGASTFLDRLGWDRVAIALGASALRGLAGYAAGRALVDRDGRGRVARMLLYALVGLAHAAVVEVVIARAWGSASAAAVAAALASWPIACIVLAGWFVDREVPPPGMPRGEPQAVAVLALVCGLFAAALAAAIVGNTVADGGLFAGLALASGVGVGVVAVLLIVAGVGGLGGGDVARLERGLDRAAAAAALVGFMLMVALVLPVITLVAIPAVTLPAIVLPAVLRHHLDQAPASLDPSGHGGSLHALGWVLLGHGLLAVTVRAAGLCLGAPWPSIAGALAVPGAAELLGLGLGILELAAAIALLGAARRARLVALLWGGAALLAAALHPSWTLGVWAAPLPLAALLVALRRGVAPAPAARLT